MEEDTGKTTHVGGGGRIHDARHSLVDYNRAGVPLVEIVSRPDIRSATQARLYAAELRGILIATGASDGRMEEGSMRVDANVSVRHPGDEYGTRCEIKNLNSLRSLVRAIEYEIGRQVARLESGGTVIQQTRHWDEDQQKTGALRSKEEAFDYRYFEARPGPSLDAAGRPTWPPPSAPCRPTAAPRWSSSSDPRGLRRPARTRSPPWSNTASMSSRTPPARRGGCRLGPGPDGQRDVSRAGTGPGSDPPATPCSAPTTRRTLSATQAKVVLSDLLENGGDPAALARNRGFEALEEDSLNAVMDELIAGHADEWERYLGGDDKLAGFFTGLAMKATQGKANGKAVAAELRRRRG